MPSDHFDRLLTAMQPEETRYSYLKAIMYNTIVINPTSGWGTTTLTWIADEHAASCVCTVKTK